MIKLLNAGFLRLKANNIFKALLGIVIVIALFMIYTEYKDMKQLGTPAEVEQLIFNLVTMCGVGISVLVSFFIGTEYSDGTIRNKVIVGNNRIKIYLSNFILMFVSSLAIYLLFILVICCIGIPLFGGFTISLSTFYLKMIGVMGVILVYNAIFTFISMIIQNKTASSVGSVLIVFGLIIVSLIIFNILSEPPTIKTASMTNASNGGVEFVEEPNPNYPTETEKKIYQTILDIIPAGQAFQIAGRSETDLRILPIYSLIITILFTGFGLIVFNRKDLR